MLQKMLFLALRIKKNRKRIERECEEYFGYCPNTTWFDTLLEIERSDTLELKKIFDKSYPKESMVLEDEDGFGVSLCGPNPELKNFVSCRTKDDAYRLKDIFDVFLSHNRFANNG